jgi:hypothetical protein
MNKSKQYDLAVAYRICPRMSRTAPPVFADSKYRLAELCLRSFKAALGDIKAKVWVILDNCPPEYEGLFASLFPSEDLVLLRELEIGNGATFQRQVEILTAQDDADFVFLAEDDYVYLPGSLKQLVELVKTHFDVDFCTPYDHPDYYSRSFHRHEMEIKIHDAQVWKTAGSTTCTLLTRKSTLIQTKSTLLSYARKNTDLGMWLSLTKQRVINPCDLLVQPFLFPFLGWSLFCAWFFNWRQILFGHKYKLWVPVPSLATHMVEALLAPGVDWNGEFGCQSGKGA